MANAHKLVPFILKWEGGFVDDPLDRGGATNKGITLKTFQYHFGKNKTVNDLKNITDEQWFEIFKEDFWDRWKADEIKNQSIANILVDWVWASGKYGITNAQRILKVPVDGVVGSKTIEAINNYPNQRMLFGKILTERLAYVNKIVKANPSQKKFLNGWKNRIVAFKYFDDGQDKQTYANRSLSGK